MNQITYMHIVNIFTSKHKEAVFIPQYFSAYI